MVSLGIIEVPKSEAQPIAEDPLQALNYTKKYLFYVYVTLMYSTKEIMPHVMKNVYFCIRPNCFIVARPI